MVIVSTVPLGPAAAWLGAKKGGWHADLGLSGSLSFPLAGGRHRLLTHQSPSSNLGGDLQHSPEDHEQLPA